VVTRLYADISRFEADYFRKTRIFPIMHVVVLRNARVRARPLDRHEPPQGLRGTKRGSLARIADIGVSHVPLLWIAAQVRRWRALAGEISGLTAVEPNRRRSKHSCNILSSRGRSDRSAWRSKISSRAKRLESSRSSRSDAEVLDHLGVISRSRGGSAPRIPPARGHRGPGRPELLRRCFTSLRFERAPDFGAQALQHRLWQSRRRGRTAELRC